MFLTGMLARDRTRVKASPWAGLVRAVGWLPAAAWMGGIFYLSNRSTPLGSIGDNFSAVPGHLGLYAGLGLLLYWTLAGAAGRHAEASAWVLTALAFALTVLYGVLDELHQAFVPGRVASEADLVLDAAGALFGVAVASLAASFLKARRARQQHAG